MTVKDALAISMTNRLTCSDRKPEFSIPTLTERIVRLYPIACNESQSADFTKSEHESRSQADDAATTNPNLTAERLVTAMDSAVDRARAIDVFADTLRLVSPVELRSFRVVADIFEAYDSRNDLSEFFRECSILAALVARNVALRDGSVSIDKAFLSGVLSEVGSLACLKIDTVGFQGIWNQSGGLPGRRAEMEIATYGGTTHELGSNLLIHYGFPSDVSDAVGTRVSEQTKICNPLARIVTFSRTVAVELRRCSQRKHEQNLIATLPKFGAFFNLQVDRELLGNPSIKALLRRDIE